MRPTRGRGLWARGALIMVVSTLISTTSALCVKLIGDRVPLFEIVVRARCPHAGLACMPSHHGAVAGLVVTCARTSAAPVLAACCLVHEDDRPTLCAWYTRGAHPLGSKQPVERALPDTAMRARAALQVARQCAAVLVLRAHAARDERVRASSVVASVCRRARRASSRGPCVCHARV